MAQQKPAPLSKALLNKTMPASMAVDNEISPDQPVNFVVNSKGVLDEMIGGSRYDMQTNASIQNNRVCLWPDGNISATWTMGFTDPGYADRGTGYNYFNGTTWNAAPTARIETMKCGWPSVHPWNGGGEMILSHNSTTHLVVNTRPVKGTGAWTQNLRLTAPTGAFGLVWPRTVTSGSNHQYIHTLVVTTPVANGGTLYQGLDGALIYYRSLDGGATWDKQGVILPGLTSATYVGFSGDDYSWAEPHGDTLVFVQGGQWTDTFMMKSTDNGNTWTKTEILPNYYCKNSGTVTTPSFICSAGDVACEMDKSGVTHVAFGRMRATNDGTGHKYFPGTDGIVYWNSTMPVLDTAVVSNINTLIAANLCIGFVVDNGNPNDSIVGFPAYGTGLSSFPQIIIDNYNNIFFLWSSLTVGNPSPDPLNYRHIWTRAWFKGNALWNDMIDLNSGVLYMFQEYVYPSVASSLKGNKILLFDQTSSQPGANIKDATVPIHDVNIEFREIPVSTYGAVLSVYPANQNVAPEAGSTVFNVYSSANWTATKTAAWLTITPSGSGPGPLTATFTANTTGSARVANITVAMSGATSVIVTVTQQSAGTGYTVSGTIAYPNASTTPLSAVTLNLKNSSGTVVGTATTNASGLYSFSNVGNGSYTLAPSTTKTWGGVTASDVLLFKKHIGNIAFLQGIFLASGDVNGSGSLSAADVLLVKKRIGSLINSFSVGDWLFNNTPVTVNGANVTQNFNGLCYGDANGSFTPPAKGAPVVAPKSALTTGVLTIAPYFPLVTGPITVSVQASQIVNMGSFQFSIVYDPAVMTYTGATDWYAGISSVSVGEPTPGHITFVWAADAAGINIPDATFFNLQFNYNYTTTSSAIVWSDNPTPREFGDWDGNIFEPAFVNGSVQGIGVGIEQNTTPSVKVYPNPASDFVEIKSDNNIQSIEVMSYLGQVVYSMQDVENKYARINVSGLQSGVYFIKVKTANGTKVVKTTVTR